METELDVQDHAVPGPMSVVTAAMRSDYAESHAKTVRRVADTNRLGLEAIQAIQAKMLHKLFHWICRQGTHFPHTAAVVDRLERIAERLVEREVRRRNRERLRYGVDTLDDEHTRQVLGDPHRPRGPIPLDIFLKAWLQLTFAEQQILILEDLKYGTDEIALILDVSPNAVEFYRSQRRAKIHRTYRSL
jgi:hypothetical protein